jgi:UPF0755 protein
VSASRRPRPTRTPPSAARTLLWLGLILVMAGALLYGLLRGSVSGDDAPEAVPVATGAEPPPMPLTIPEGLRREDIAALVEEETELSGDAYLEATAPSRRGARLAGTDEETSLEGFLFPATYQIGTRTTVADLVDAQVEAYRARAADIDYSYARSRNLTPYDVLILASMIEREVQVPAERPLVASVMYNRLRLGMRLDIDATVQYALGSWKPELTASDLRTDSPYNTRRYGGLPPGPISNPGESSLRAAARPSATDFIYYVARGDGTGRHYFSSNAAEFAEDQARAAG